MTRLRTRLAAAAALLLTGALAVTGCTQDDDADFNTGRTQVLAFDIHTDVLGMPDGWDDYLAYGAEGLEGETTQRHESAVEGFLARTKRGDGFGGVPEFYDAVIVARGELNETPGLGQRYITWLEDHADEAVATPTALVNAYLDDLDASSVSTADTDAEAIREVWERVERDGLPEPDAP